MQESWATVFGHSKVFETMAAACSALGEHFDACEGDLNAIAKALEAEFETSGKYRAHMNPAKMLQRIKALRDDLPKVRFDVLSLPSLAMACLGPLIATPCV
jgi:hypothetical protein